VDSMSISISRQIIADMLQQAEQAYPAECCGFILGQTGEEQADGHYYIACQNTRQEHREQRFLIDPQIYQDVEDRANQEGRAIISIVHSHPDHPDEPSEFDRRHAWPGVGVHLNDFNRDEEIIVHCKSGVRSAQMCDLLLQHGFTKPVNLKGGIMAWAQEVDLHMQKY